MPAVALKDRAGALNKDGPPAVVLSPIRRWQIADLDEWLLERLRIVWPQFNRLAWQSKLAQYAASNDFMFVTNDDAVLCAYRIPHTITGKTSVVMEGFCFSRHGERDRVGGWTTQAEHRQPIFALYKALNGWARSFDAFRVIVGICSDIPASAVRNQMGGEYLADIL